MTSIFLKAPRLMFMRRRILVTTHSGSIRMIGANETTAKAAVATVFVQMSGELKRSITYDKVYPGLTTIPLMCKIFVRATEPAIVAPKHTNCTKKKKKKVICTKLDSI